MIDYRRLLAGEHRGPWPFSFLVRGGLWLLSLGYSAAMRWRNRRYDRGRGVQRVGVPVISVGNITTGGTGKTPFVAWLARWYRDRGMRVVLVSRGYKAAAGQQNDEALELAQRLPDVPHVQNPDRVAAANTAIAEHHAQLILLDDAFQHRRLHRDLDIVLIDALEPFGYGYVLPRGLLREPLAGLARADIVVLSRSDAVSDEVRQSIRETVQQLVPTAAWIEVAHRPQSLLAASGNTAAIETLSSSGQRIAAFCGIGNPGGFRHTLSACGLEVAGFREFPDHHGYSAGDLDELARWLATLSDVTAVVCTHKDLVKINADRIGHWPLWALSVGVEVVVGREELEQRCQQQTGVVD